MPINVIMLILSLCGAGNPTSCRHDMTECYREKHSEELRYGARVDERESEHGGGCFGHGKQYPETALVYECALDLGIPFDVPVIPEEIESIPINPEPSPEAPVGGLVDDNEDYSR